jgi:hypothetical protein
MGRANANSKNNMPLSGSEETFSEGTYGTTKGRLGNNCYQWAIDAYSDRKNFKLQPGQIAGIDTDIDLSDCRDLKRRVLADLKGDIYSANADKPCRKGFYKIMNVLAKNSDYHWYKQNRDVLVRTDRHSAEDIARTFRVPVANVAMGRSHALVLGADVWSHKQGNATGPLLKDACGKIIKDPRTACRDYPVYKYDTFCGAYCVRKTLRTLRFDGEKVSVERAVGKNAAQRTVANDIAKSVRSKTVSKTVSKTRRAPPRVSNAKNKPVLK